MTSIGMEILISAATLVLSVASSMFVAGTRWGRVEADIRNLKEGDLRVISDRLARIEGMFTLTFKEPPKE